jgi:hypothetical protein
MSTYNLETHPKFCYLHSFLSNLTSETFEDFLSEANAISDVIASSISEDNMNVYGFNYFVKPFYPNDIPGLKQTIKNKVIGDIFELFAAFFVQYFETGFPFSIKRGTYVFGGDLGSNLDETDLGMDGYGIFSSTGRNAVIQVKYRSNPKDKPFTKNVFMSLLGEAIIKEKIVYGDSDQRLIFFTNIPIGTKDSWDGKTNQFNNLCNACKIPIVKIGKNEITALVGSKKNNESNQDFWNTFKTQFSIN